MTKFKQFISVFCVLCLLVLCSGDVYGGESAKAAPESQKASKVAKININTAGAQQLTRLPRVGEKTARRIIQFREKNGKFKRIQDIMKVKGIGEKTFKKFQDKISV
ncbi:MAG: helix-hairpin-helix domain-containing protein [bacterium]|nr:helix-hairpin-helix domain-containing protein [bacterium]